MDTFTWNVIQDHNGLDLLKKRANIYNFLVALSWVESSWNTCSVKVSNEYFITPVREWIRENQSYTMILSGWNTTEYSKCVISRKNVLASSTWNAQELSFRHAHERYSAFVSVKSTYLRALLYLFFTWKLSNKRILFMLK